MVRTRRSEAVRPGRLAVSRIAGPSARAILPVAPQVSMSRIFIPPMSLGASLLWPQTTDDK